MDVIIRAENIADYDQIREINNEAFNQKNEGKLVDLLRQNNRFVKELSLVAEYNNNLLGHILFFPVNIIQGNKIFETLSLAPMSVLPNFQSKGIGGKLVRAGLDVARKMKYKSVFVLGHSKYYPKFGFEKASRWGISCPYEVPDEVFMAIELVPGALDGIKGIIQYPVEFDEVG